MRFNLPNVMSSKQDVDSCREAPDATVSVLPGWRMICVLLPTVAVAFIVTVQNWPSTNVHPDPMVNAEKETSALSDMIIRALSGYVAEMVPPVITCRGAEMLFIEV